MPNSQSDNNVSFGQSEASKLPTGRNEDVEFSSDIADAEDLEAVLRAKAADERQEES
ncbi:YfhD family protein [Paenibacillus albiflavus]|uniref:YfhD family protein n=1 Tax=Paenibacillus albiflavus TaxID=2545760 RepID=A0A4R4EBI0_9BACL|nr:YfhD family protein [Paenibacillus albiflavus]TCZ77254.1 YfhD family protein [Paenibacillus albiflavus]